MTADSTMHKSGRDADYANAVRKGNPINGNSDGQEEVEDKYDTTEGRQHFKYEIIEPELTETPIGCDEVGI
ncbi:hypothetical protein PQX77_009492 [Marasmius sp. AFHP31]|nr:hypothetical protein PQX77_009492 [Marasmius sp. AFHP31]